MKLYRCLTVLIVSALLLTLLCPAALAAVECPEASEDFYVYDEAEVFSAKLKTTILEENDRLNRDYQVQLVMVAMKTLDGADIKDFTVSLMDKWAIGGEDGKGLVLVLDIAGDNYFTLAGKGLRSFLTSDTLQRLLDRNLEESFSMKNYDAGVGSFFAAVSARITEEFGTPTESSEESSETGESESSEESAEPSTQEPSSSEPESSTPAETPPAVTQPTDTAPKAADGGFGFWALLKAIFWIALVLLCLALLLFVALIIRRRRYEKRRAARRRERQQGNRLS